MTARAFLGAGDLYISRYENGAFQPYEGPFESDKFSIKPNSDLKEKTSKGRYTYGQVIESVPVPQPSDLTISLAEVNKSSLAIALMGTTGSVAQTAGTLADAPITAKLGKWADLGKLRLTQGTVVVTNSAGTTTYDEGEDYIVNYSFGWIKVLEGGAITADAALKVDASYGAVNGTEIKGSTQTQIRARFKLDGVNFADNAEVVVTVHEAVLNPSSEFDFLADDFASVELGGRMKTPVGFIEPYTVRLL